MKMLKCFYKSAPIRFISILLVCFSGKCPEKHESIAIELPQPSKDVIQENLNFLKAAISLFDS